MAGHRQADARAASARLAPFLLDFFCRPLQHLYACRYITQAHSSDDDQVHSATVQDTSWNRLGCVVARGRQYAYYATPAGSTFDECHVDKSGRWLMILEARSSGAQINRLVDLTSGAMTVIEDADGALGHLDMGFEYAVGADNYNSYPNATILLKFPVTNPHRPIGPVVHYNKPWDIVAANHVTHGNASLLTKRLPQYPCGSHASRVADMADEIVCFSLDPDRNLDGSLDVLVVGQVLTDLNAPGGSDYAYATADTASAPLTNTTAGISAR